MTHFYKNERKQNIQYVLLMNISLLGVHTFLSVNDSNTCCADPT